mmetsp:Transcript_23390/g.67396  ORF Transcript_23390/g.67396 Transcript_23390/m.67396 type:complete len:655 (-) Transcript_23390:1675-3639(-)
MSAAVDGAEHLELVFYNLHRRVSLFVLRKTSHRSRSIVEHSVLVCGVCVFCIVLLCHRTFVYRGLSAGLPEGGGVGGSAGGVGGAILDRLLTYEYGSAHARDAAGTKGGTLPARCLRDVPGFQDSFDVLQVAVGDEDLDQSYAYFYDYNDENITGDPSACGESSEGTAKASTKVAFEPDYSYSKAKGLLLLPPDPTIQKKHNVLVQRVVVSRQDTSCFGEEFLQGLVFRMVGPTTVELNWLLALNDGEGYILPNGGQIIDLSRYASDYYFLLPKAWDTLTAVQQEYSGSGDRTQQRRGRSFIVFKLSVLVSSTFLFFVTTTLVAFTLKETQDRMLNFTFHLQQSVRQGSPIGHLVATHVIENMVFVPIMLGTIFFLIEFYGGDKFLAFIVLTLVWCAEVFSVLSMRTHIGTVFFPRVFFLWFTLHHAYYFSCPFGFLYASLLSSVLFLVHSMLFFYNRYELPAVLNDRGTERAAAPVASRPGLPPAIDALTPDNERRPGPVLLPRPLNRDRNHPSITSLASSSLGRGSVAGGLNILFQNGGSHDGDDGDDSSYMFFMNGEIVGHRDRNARRPGPPSTINTGRGEEEPETMPESERRVLTTDTSTASITQQSESPEAAPRNSNSPRISARGLFPLSLWDRHAGQQRAPTQSPSES